MVDAIRGLSKVMPDVDEGLTRSEVQSALSASQPQSQGAPPGGGPLGMAGAGRPRPNVMAGPPMGGMR